jgi:hypothetical protein
MVWYDTVIIRLGIAYNIVMIIWLTNLLPFRRKSGRKKRRNKRKKERMTRKIKRTKRKRKVFSRKFPTDLSERRIFL